MSLLNYLGFTFWVHNMANPLPDTFSAEINRCYTGSAIWHVALFMISCKTNVNEFSHFSSRFVVWTCSEHELDSGNSEFVCLGSVLSSGLNPEPNFGHICSSQILQKNWMKPNLSSTRWAQAWSCPHFIKYLFVHTHTCNQLGYNLPSILHSPLWISSIHQPLL